MRRQGKEVLEYADFLSLTASSLNGVFLLSEEYFPWLLRLHIAVGYCDNDKLYPDYIVKRSHVAELVFHKWLKDKKLAEIWWKQVARARARRALMFAPTIFLRENECQIIPKQITLPCLWWFLSISNPTHQKRVNEIDYRCGKGLSALNVKGVLNQKTNCRRSQTPAKTTLLFINYINTVWAFN